MADNFIQNDELPMDLDLEKEKFVIDYVMEKTGSTVDDIILAVKVVSKNWMKIMYYLKKQAMPNDD